jgi:NAD(P)-dependent dehydrogenase (short-subunit alcohol dehydrogenase family)
MLQRSGRTAIVTGAASGIGRAMAERFAAVGMRVVLADVEEPRLRAVERDLSDARRPMRMSNGRLVETAIGSQAAGSARSTWAGQLAGSPLL